MDTSHVSCEITHQHMWYRYIKFVHNVLLITIVYWIHKVTYMLVRCLLTQDVMAWIHILICFSRKILDSLDYQGKWLIISPQFDADSVNLTINLQTGMVLSWLITNMQLVAECYISFHGKVWYRRPTEWANCHVQSTWLDTAMCLIFRKYTFFNLAENMMKE